MGQSKAGIQSCVAINKKDDDRRGALRQAQKTVGEVIRVKELAIAGTKRKQQVMEDLVTSPTKQQSVESSLIGTPKTGYKEVDAMLTRPRRGFCRPKLCGPMLQRCHQRHGMNCT
jgi:hypothetical protein